MMDGSGERLDSPEIARIRSALDHAGRPDTAVKFALQLDREAVALVRESREPDALLEGIDLDRIASLADRAVRLLESGPAESADAARGNGWGVLDLLRRPSVLRRIPPDERGPWADRTLALVEASHFTVGPLLRQRCEEYGDRTLFEIPRGDGVRRLSWRQVATRVDFLARGLLSLDSSDQPPPIAILSENRIEMALTDLACLSTGLTNVMIPAHATEADVGFMLEHSGAGTIVVSDQRQLDKVLKVREKIATLDRIVAIDPAAAATPGVLSLDDLAARATHIPSSLVRARGDAVRIDARATLMYTSGTTGQPKAIQFSQRNLVFKRFARALALPEIGEHDRFFCFLPLYHTFGRFLEMLGCVFWGATYAFAENPSVEALLGGMRRFRPTVFISVPKKWMQLHEAIAERADPDEATDAQIERAVIDVTGGALRWGLSAAGYLPAETFLFFQRNGVELMSGFGMTEATGGITMTPPGQYREDSLGLPLPGIECKIAEDGELLVRGPYVMIGYLDPPAGEASMTEDGWLHTGDLMERDHEGHLRLIDRKKEIYKNVKGETIAPQRVESMFRDFGSIGRVFLVGDHREYNTLLIYPNPAQSEPDLSKLSEREVWNHFRSLVVSVNKFLSPFERVVDFAMIDRDLDLERGELTEKGTPRRRNVERNFADVVRQLYQRADLTVDGVTLTLPNWLFQVLGMTAQDVRVDQGKLVWATTGATLTVERRSASTVRIGDGLYRCPPGPLNLGILLTSAPLWLGNTELVDFLPLELSDRQRPGRPFRGIEWRRRADPGEENPDDIAAVQQALGRSEFTLLDLHLAARMIGSEESLSLTALELIDKILGSKSSTLRRACRLVLTRAAGSSSLRVRRRAFRLLLPAESEARFAKMAERFLIGHPELLADDAIPDLAEPSLSPEKVEVLVELALAACARDEDPLAVPLLRFLAAYGAAHPISYSRLRAVLIRVRLSALDERVRSEAAGAVAWLLQGFRDWLGSTRRIAVDPEDGHEYRWEEVVAFEDGIAEEDQARLMSAIRDTAFLREALFLFSSNLLIHLSDIPPGGVWVRLLGSRHGKSVYRITVQTRFRGSHDLAANLTHELPRESVEEEINWLILAGDPGGRGPLVEDFGGYWSEQGLWSEEFISGDTLDRALQRLSRRRGAEEQLSQAWPFLAWSTISAWVDFWNRSGRRVEIGDPSMSNIVVPTEDYHVGARIVSLAARREHQGLAPMIEGFLNDFVRPTEKQYPALGGQVDLRLVLSAITEILGEDETLQSFGDVLRTGRPSPEVAAGLRSYIEETRHRGFRPMRLHFAIERYLRWEHLGEGPTVQARVATLMELYSTYGLDRLTRHYPEARFRLFRDTVLRNAPEGLVAGLDELIRRIRAGELAEEDYVDALAELSSRLPGGTDEEYFLTRMSFPHLRPEDTAGFVSSYLGGRQQSEIVVALEDDDGQRYNVRHALSPKEVERLHSLFVGARLDVRFRAEHQYLVAMSERDRIIAGIYYEIEEGGRTAHLEKIVVIDRYRRKGVADGLMSEFFHRLRAAGVRNVTTGFFRPEFFYAYGFRIEPRYAGLVKSLDPDAERETDSVNGPGNGATRS